MEMVIKMHGKNILVTGGTGFIGLRLIERLIEEGAKVQVLIRDGTKTRLLRRFSVAVVYGDVTSRESLQKAIKDCDFVFHLATGGGGVIKEARYINVQGTRNVIEMAAGAGVSRVIHFSSVAVHGYNLPSKVDESCAFDFSGDTYTVSKAEGELVATECARKLKIDVVIIRPTCVYGPHSPIWTLNFFNRVKNEQILLINGGKGLSNLIYINDLIDGCILAARKKEAAGEVFILNGQSPVLWKYYLGSFAKMCCKPLPSSISVPLAQAYLFAGIKYCKVTRRQLKIYPSDLNLMKLHTEFVIDKAKKILDFHPGTNLTEGMALTETWLKESGYLGEKS